MRAALGASTPESGSSSSSTRRVLDERAGDQHALALAARERAEAVAGAVGEPDPVERGVGGGAVARG